MISRRAFVCLLAGLLIVAGGSWWLISGREKPLPELEILCRDAPDCRLTALLRMANAPFPYTPNVGEASFFADPGGLFSGRRRVVRPGLSYSEKTHYLDDRVLVHVPPGFEATKPFAILLYFHGHRATLKDTVLRKRRIATQVTESGRNLILIAPQFARDAIDSHAGKFVRTGAVASLISEAMNHLRARFPKLAPSVDRTAQAPIIIAAFSGGWWPAAAGVSRGMTGKGISAVILLDAFYGAEKSFASWLAADPAKRMLIGVHSQSSAEGAERLRRLLSDANRKVARGLNSRLEPGSVTIISVETAHEKLPVDGPPALPLATILGRLPPWARLSSKDRPGRSGRSSRTDLPPLKP
jgi:hypothetical protein